MVNSINGILTFKLNGLVGIQTSGLEWAVETTTTTIATLPEIGGKVRLLTYLHHTQDVMRLYGFFSEEERRLFFALISVSGVGASLAKKILSGTTSDRFLVAMDTEDVDFLASIPGLGKKTAQKIVLQLRGKLIHTPEVMHHDAGKEKDVVEALTAMGFDAKGVEKAVRSVLEDPEVAILMGDKKEKEIMRRAIIALST